MHTDAERKHAVEAARARGGEDESSLLDCTDPCRGNMSIKSYKKEIFLT